MMKNCTTFKYGSLSTVCLLMASVFLSLSVNTMATPAYARTVTQIQTSIMDKAVLQGVYDCYTGGYVKKKIDPLSDYTGISSLMEGNSGEDFIPLVTAVGNNGFGGGSRYSVKDSGLSCSQLFEGGSYSMANNNYNKGILEATGHSIPSANDSEAVMEFVKNMGYQVVADTGDQCYSIPYSLQISTGSTEAGTTNKVCEKPDGSLYTEGGDDNWANFKIKSSGILGIGKKNTVCLSIGKGAGAITKECSTLSGTSFDGEWLMSIINKSCGGNECSQNVQGRTFDYVFTEVINDVSSQTSLSNSSASFTDAVAAAGIAVNYLSNGQYSNSSDLSISDIEKRILYQAYLEQYYNVKPNCAEGHGDSIYFSPAM